MTDYLEQAINEIASSVAGRQSMYKLKIVDMHGTAYVVCGEREKMLAAIDWFKQDLGEAWLHLTGTDDDVSHREIQVVVSRESIAGMLLGKV